MHEDKKTAQTGDFVVVEVFFSPSLSRFASV